MSIGSEIAIILILILINGVLAMSEAALVASRKARLQQKESEGHKSATLCHLGNIATRLNRSIRFDPGGETIVGDAEAIALMARAYRAPWRLEQYL
ncbi:MAG TPA: CNNM domain-containing protein [Candidatus Hydrogenedentes bacterium]|nr:CNNM domain-containing protein [Candidatus Hydrogenedentota bacterium]